MVLPSTARKGRLFVVPNEIEPDKVEVQKKEDVEHPTPLHPSHFKSVTHLERSTPLAGLPQTS